MWPFDKRAKTVHEDNAFTAINHELERLYKLREHYSSHHRNASEEQVKTIQEHFWNAQKDIKKFQDLLIELAQKSADPEHLAKIKDMQQVVAEAILLGKDK